MAQQRIGKFLVERRLGSGSFATVWLATDPDLAAQVAIKVLADNWSANDEIKRRFVQEARTLRSLGHPRVVQVYATDALDDGRPYFVMEYADQGSLHERIAARRAADQPFSPAEVVAIGRAMAEGLAVAHARNIVHRDLKPSNILFSTVPAHHQPLAPSTGAAEAPDRMLLADFGIARELEAVVRSTISAGTPQYMAPEQAIGRPDRRSDIYSAAVILYELLAGRVPYPFESMSDVVRTDRTVRFAPIRTVRPDVPPALAEAIETGLQADADRRFSSVHEWDDALRRAAGAGLRDTSHIVAALDQPPATVADVEFTPVPPAPPEPTVVSSAATATAPDQGAAASRTPSRRPVRLTRSTGSPLMTVGVLGALVIGVICAWTMPAERISVEPSNLVVEFSLREVLDDESNDADWWTGLSMVGVAIAVLSAFGAISGPNANARAIARNQAVGVTIGAALGLVLPGYILYDISRLVDEVARDGDDVSGNLGTGQVLFAITLVLAAIIPWAKLWSASRTDPSRPLGSRQASVASNSAASPSAPIASIPLGPTNNEAAAKVPRPDGCVVSAADPIRDDAREAASPWDDLR